MILSSQDVLKLKMATCNQVAVSIASGSISFRKKMRSIFLVQLLIKLAITSF